MAKATITIEDVSETEINIKLDFDPPLKKADLENATLSQYAALDVVRHLQDTETDDGI